MRTAVTAGGSTRPSDASDRSDVAGRDPADADLVDARLVGPAVAAWVSAALVLGGPAWGGLTAGLLLVGGALAARPRHRTGAAALTAAAAAALVAALRVAQVGAGPVPDLAAEEAVVEASVVVTGDVHTVAGGFADSDVVTASMREVTGRAFERRCGRRCC